LSESKEKEKMDLCGNDMEYASIIVLKRRIKFLLTGRAVGPVALPVRIQPSTHLRGRT